MDTFYGGEVAGDVLQAVEDDSGSFGVHLVGGDADEDVGESELEAVAVVDVFDGEGVVGEDGDALDAVMEAGELVAQGVGAALDAFGVGVNALVGLGRVLLEFGIEGHGVPPPGGYLRVSVFIFNTLKRLLSAKSSI